MDVPASYAREIDSEGVLVAKISVFSLNDCGRFRSAVKVRS